MDIGSDNNISRATKAYRITQRPDYASLPPVYSDGLSGDISWTRRDWYILAGGGALLIVALGLLCLMVYGGH